MAFGKDDEDVGDFEDDDRRQGLIINPTTGEAWTSKNDSGMVHRRAGTYLEISLSIQNHVCLLKLVYIPVIMEIMTVTQVM